MIIVRQPVLHGQFIMEQHDYSYDYNPDLTPEKAFLTIWTKPRATFLHMIRYYPKDYVWLLFFMGGLTKAIDRAILQDKGDTTPIPVIFLFAAIFGAPISMLLLNIYSGLISWTGGWLKGTGTPQECRTVLAWSLVPMISSLLLLIPEFALFGTTVFTSEAAPYPIPEMVFMAIEILLAAWTVRTFTIGISLVHEFGIGKAILNMLLAGGVIIACFVGVALLFDILF